MLSVEEEEGGEESDPYIIYKAKPSALHYWNKGVYGFTRGQQILYLCKFSFNEQEQQQQFPTPI